VCLCPYLPELPARGILKADLEKPEIRALLAPPAERFR
jgi:hypothetical protein